MKLLHRLLAVAAVLALVPLGSQADDVDVSVRIPSTSAAPSGPRTVDDAVLSWAVNAEAGSGAFFGGCNFLSAGKAGDAGSSRVWGEDDGLYRSRDGNVTIEKPTSAEAWKQADFANRCNDERGSTPRRVTTAGNDYGTGNRFVFSDGEGALDPGAGTATIRWRGTVTVAAYGGLSYFWLSDPILKVSGRIGTLTATAGGFASSREDVGTWAPLSERTVTLATLSDVDLSGVLGFTAIPAYRGLAVTTASSGAAQDREGPDWGSFPQDFINFQNDVGQAAYWYSTGGLRDFAKPPTLLGVSWSAADRVDGGVPVDPPRGDQTTTSNQTATPQASGASTPKTNSSTTTATTATPATGAAPAVAAPNPSGTQTGSDYPATTPDALQAGVRGLIPAAAAVLEDPRARFVTAASALVALSTTAFVGFRRRWFVLPWSRHNRD